MNLNLADIQSIGSISANNLNKLIKDGPSLQNEYINEWRRYIKYAIDKKKVDKNNDLYVNKEEVFKLSVIYSSDTNKKVERIIEILKDNSYIYEIDDRYYFNKELYSNVLEELDNSEKVIVKNNNALLIPVPWEFYETARTLCLVGTSEISRDLILIGAIPKDFFDEEDNRACLDEFVNTSINAPKCFKLLYDVLPYVKKDGDFVLTKAIKDIIRDIENFNSSIKSVNDPGDLYDIIQMNINGDLVCVEILNSSDSDGRAITIVNDYGSVLLSKVKGIESLSVICSLGAISNQAKMIDILYLVLQKVRLNKDLKNKVREVLC